MKPKVVNISLNIAANIATTIDATITPNAVSNSNENLGLNNIFQLDQNILNTELPERTVLMKDYETRDYEIRTT